MNSTSGGVHVHIIGIHAGVWAAVAWYQGASDAMMDNVLPVSMDYFSVEEHHGKRKIMAFVLTFETSRKYLSLHGLWTEMCEIKFQTASVFG
ncbi:hypothetical protein Y1Q_0019481 [Alligator mississippiensis]|uniref:Uncharacterized protein n=1 Tax=Alligator mississippiensis TaxID=8496 RepID=A0A151NMF3_ALLMI|nr:hypothetical protein Y1Q_0019481 [Alligator mississippiensis]